MTPPTPAEVGELLRSAAREELLPRFAAVQHHVKHDGSLVTEADLALQARLRRELTGRWPQYDFLAEEMGGQEHELLAAVALGRASRVDGGPPSAAVNGLWCLDPLDGTSNFAAGIPFFAASLALLVGGEPRLGIVYDPVRDECFSARRGGGAFLNGERIAPAVAPAEVRRCIACVDFKRLERALAARLATHQPFGSQRNFGASSLEWCWLADSRFHLYLHGGQKLWDYAAGWLILEEAGGCSTTLSGEPVFRLQLEPRSVIATRAATLFVPWRDALAGERPAR
jgi:myo-inositol-1(or 4)-monophosphatase